jgi:hypothetical protein
MNNLDVLSGAYNSTKAYNRLTSITLSEKQKFEYQLNNKINDSVLLAKQKIQALKKNGFDHNGEYSYNNF